MPPETRESDTGPLQPLHLIKGKTPTEVLDSIVAASIAQIVLAVAAVLAICYWGKVPFITLSFALLLAFILAPVADLFERWHSPRWASSSVARR